jgi:hypothetical protein
MRLALAPIVLLGLAACATKPPPPACLSGIEAQNNSIGVALERTFPDPKGHHDLVGPRVLDSHGNLAMDIEVWPLSGPQEPAPPHRIRVVLAACTLKVLKAEKLS